MKKPIAFVVLGLVTLVGLLFSIKAAQIRAMISQGEQAVPPPETVTTAVVEARSWEIALTAVGSLTAVNGVTLSAELPGRVVEIAFVPGAATKKGDVLLRQDTSTEEAQLPGAMAHAMQTRAARERDARMLKKALISQADYEASDANYKEAKAATDDLLATIAKKTIRAPFSGRLGIRQVNLGQLLRQGDEIVTLQSLNPIFVNFTFPQQNLTQIHPGLPVRLACDCLPGGAIHGRVTAINPLVDADTRSVQLQATVQNHAERLRPGMFVDVAVVLPTREEVLAVPATAVLYAPYGNSIFVIDDAGDGMKAVRQQFVRLGKKRGDFVAVIEGLKEGEEIVSTGVFKLRNGERVTVDNRLAPLFREVPTPANDSQ